MSTNNNVIINDRTGFEVYLEGIKAPTFSAMTIREIEGDFPSASISFPASSSILRILPGTIVQIFGPEPITSDKILVFEGEVHSVSYQKSSGSRFVNFSCTSLLSSWETVTTRPPDALITPKFRQALGEWDYRYLNLTEDNKEQNQQQAVSIFSAIAQARQERHSQEITGELKEALENFNITAVGEFKDTFAQLLNETRIEEGDIHFFLQFFLNKFELLDPFYGIQAGSYNFADSVLGLPNKGRMEPFKIKAIFENTFKLARNVKNPFQGGGLRLLVAIQELLETTHFSMISPSGYTLANNF